MDSDKTHFSSLVKLLLPPEIFDYFEITDIQTTNTEVNVYLNEQNVIPDEYIKEHLSSKGFHKTSIVQDFPLRDRAMFLHVRRRRWLDSTSGKLVSRDWRSVAEGTRLTKDFATFLKEISRHISNK